MRTRSNITCLVILALMVLIVALFAYGMITTHPTPYQVTATYGAEMFHAQLTAEAQP